MSNYEQWEGLLAGIDKDAKRIFFTIQDQRETETPWINSASSWTDIAFDYVNLLDQKYHYLMFGWSSSGTDGSNTGCNIIGTTQDVIRKGIIGVDNFVFAPQDDKVSSISGKSTTMSFVYDNVGNGTNWAFGGYYPDRNSSTAKTNNFNATKCFNGEIAEITIWDTLLNGNATLNDLAVQNNIGGAWGAAAKGDHPLTSSSLATYKSNTVAHFDLTHPSLNTMLATDEAPATISGNQTNPTTGHTLYLVGPNSNLFGIWDYLIYDVMQNNNTIHFPNGLLQFVDETGSQKNIGIIFYDFGLMILDNEYVIGSNSGLPFINTMSISGMGFGNLTGFNVHYINFDSVNEFQRLIINAKAESDEFNITQNTTGVITQTGKQLIAQNQGTYPTTVGLYNPLDDLIAIAKINKPLRKDIDHSNTISINLDF